MNYTLERLEKDLKQGRLKAEYLDGLHSYIRVSDKKGNNVVICDPKSLIAMMCDFCMEGLKKRKRKEDREELAEILRSLVKYRLDHTGGLGGSRPSLNGRI